MQELVAVCERVLKSGQYILGPEVEGFEKECQSYIGAKFAYGVSSGTDALVLALMALGIGPGDEVICPTFSFFATAGAVWRVGAVPVFVDVDPVTFNTNAALIAAKVTPRTKAVIPVHLFGQAADMGPIVALARERHFKVIEDAAQAIGAEDGGQRAGNIGDVGCFSFYPTKNLGAIGDAGLVTTNDQALAERMKIMRVHGGQPKYYHAVVGGNFRIDALQAALLRVKLRSLEEAHTHRRHHAALYTKLLSNVEGLVLPQAVKQVHTFNQFVVRVPGKRDALQAHLKSKGVATEIYYPVPLHLQRCFSELGYKAGDFAVSERAASDVLALPIFAELREDEVTYVAEETRKFFGR
jgi:dTDP-4-amino-4,6-dideoxygalactose transaminase